MRRLRLGEPGCRDPLRTRPSAILRVGAAVTPSAAVGTGLRTRPRVDAHLTPALHSSLPWKRLPLMYKAAIQSRALPASVQPLLSSQFSVELRGEKQTAIVPGGESCRGIFPTRQSTGPWSRRFWERGMGRGFSRSYCPVPRALFCLQGCPSPMEPCDPTPPPALTPLTRRTTAP